MRKLDTIKDKIAAVDDKDLSLWKNLPEELQKSLKKDFYILNRYISNVKSSNVEIQEHFVIVVNEYYNKHWNTLQKHPHLLWQLLCLCSLDKKKFYHEWIGLKRRPSANSKKTKFLSELYPSMKISDVELLSDLYSDKEIIDLARDLGNDEATVKKLFK
jgi:hypothetical protein